MSGPEGGDHAATTVAESVQLLRAGRITSLTMVENAIKRIARMDHGIDGLRGVISMCSTAQVAAYASDVRRARGEMLSALDGVPVLVKDCIETADAPTTHGSLLFRGWMADEDAGSVRVLRQAGCVVLGKASLDDFAAATVGVSSMRGAMRHPLDATRTVGGSSGGSAVAVAAKYVPLTLGTDTGGSLRIPAAACGVTALRPTPGTVPGDGVFPRSFGQDVVGPIAADVFGVAAAFDLYQSVEGAEKSHADVACRARANPRGALQGMTIGVARVGLAAWGDDGMGPVVALVDRAARLLAEGGARIVDAPVPSRDLLASALVTSESAAAVDKYLAERPSSPVSSFNELWASRRYSKFAGVAFDREHALAMDEPARREHLENARSQRVALREWTSAAWKALGIDAVIYPTAQRIAGPIGLEQRGIYTRWAEHANLPALALPSGKVLSRGKWLPASVEMMTRSHQELLLIRLAAALEALIAGAERV